jgi:hypothetical protein
MALSLPAILLSVIALHSDATQQRGDSDAPAYSSSAPYQADTLVFIGWDSGRTVYSG